MSSDTSILTEYLTPEQLASELGISWRTLARWIAIREAPPSTLIGRKRLFRREAVEKWLRSRERELA